MAQTVPPAYNVIGFNPTGDIGDFTVYTSRRRGAVWFLKSPPKKPASYKQLHQRNRFRLIAELWRSLDQSTRDNWRNAALKATLHISGYALFVVYQQKRDPALIETIEMQSGISLLPIGVP